MHETSRPQLVIKYFLWHDNITSCLPYKVVDLNVLLFSWIVANKSSKSFSVSHTSWSLNHVKYYFSVCKFYHLPAQSLRNICHTSAQMIVANVFICKLLHIFVYWLFYQPKRPISLRFPIWNFQNCCEIYILRFIRRCSQLQLTLGHKTLNCSQLDRWICDYSRPFAHEAGGLQSNILPYDWQSISFFFNLKPSLAHY